MTVKHAEAAGESDDKLAFGHIRERHQIQRYLDSVEVEYAVTQSPDAYERFGEVFLSAAKVLRENDGIVPVTEVTVDRGELQQALAGIADETFSARLRQLVPGPKLAGRAHAPSMKAWRIQQVGVISCLAVIFASTGLQLISVTAGIAVMYAALAWFCLTQYTAAHIESRFHIVPVRYSLVGMVAAVGLSVTAILASI